MKYSSEVVREYYNRSQRWYSWFYIDKESLAMHGGLWEEDVRSRREALIRPYKIIKEFLSPKKGELILDAGCGVGGGSLWLAERTEAKFQGTTLSEVQVALARKYARERGLSERASFSLLDYSRTGYPDSYFNGVFSIESLCHSYSNLALVLREFWRILKPGGKFVMCDAFLRRQPDRREKKLLDKFCLGWKIDSLKTKEDIVEDLHQAGFSEIECFDKTVSIKKSIWDIYLRSLLAYLPLQILRLIGMASLIEHENFLATFSQKKLYRLGLFGYGVFYAKKL